MSESLNIIALISGGKDSFYSLLHCLQNGHKVVALANLYPSPPPPPASNEEEHDLNSFMYQTVGHTVIPLYETALGIPVYRQEIRGKAVRTGRSYGFVEPEAEAEEDETEDLVPLLKRIMTDFPDVNAVSTGAILSTYQRTRIESVAVRLGLVPLAFLWQYPVLSPPPGEQARLLWDMKGVGLDARIVKVASGGLDEGFLWENVASERAIGRVEGAMRRFGTDGDGAVIGEGGEFETLVVDGPGRLFKGRIEVKEEDFKVMREGGGSAWLSIRDANVVMKDQEEVVINECRVPSLLELVFQDILDGLFKVNGTTIHDLPSRPWLAKYTSGVCSPTSSLEEQSSKHLVFTTSQHGLSLSIEDAAQKAINDIRHHLTQSALDPSDIIFTLIILRSMSDFATVNKIYGSLFTQPNPPSRVTIACGDLLPPTTNLIIQTRTLKTATRDALHVQSRSYWAPANIGPYSQAIAVPIKKDGRDVLGSFLAGQIPLVPHTMALPGPVSNDLFMGEFKLQAVLSLQHLWRIGKEMRVGWFTSVVAYLPRRAEPNTVEHQAIIAAQTWTSMHTQSLDEDEDEEEVDLWENKFYAGRASRGATKTSKMLPDWDMIENPLHTDNQELESSTAPPFFAVEADQLPRSSMVEWHAHLGIVGGSVKLYYSEDRDWSIFQCVVNEDAVYSVVMIPWEDQSVKRKGNLEEAVSVLGTGIEQAHTAYVDFEALEIKELDWIGIAIPCRSIWNASGRRLAAVLLFEALT